MPNDLNFLGILGASGKMGKLVEKQALLKGWQVKHLSFSKEELKKQLKGLDAAVEFSSPEGLELLLDVANCPLVLASTGLNKSLKEKISKKSEFMPIFYSANYSIGLYRLMSILEKASLDPSLAKITETHHIHKKDAPSGTALMLQNFLTVTQPIESIRRDEIFGIHEISYNLGNEILSFKHEALNRDIFADGAILASEFIAEQKNGLYSMKDLIESLALDSNNSKIKYNSDLKS